MLDWTKIEIQALINIRGKEDTHRQLESVIRNTKVDQMIFAASGRYWESARRQNSGEKNSKKPNQDERISQNMQCSKPKNDQGVWMLRTLVLGQWLTWAGAPASSTDSVAWEKIHNSPQHIVWYCQTSKCLLLSPTKQHTVCSVARDSQSCFWQLSVVCIWAYTFTLNLDKSCPVLCQTKCTNIVPNIHVQIIQSYIQGIR